MCAIETHFNQLTCRNIPLVVLMQFKKFEDGSTFHSILCKKRRRKFKYNDECVQDAKFKKWSEMMIHLIYLHKKNASRHFWVFSHD